jgi:hypothetical protein
MYTITNEIQTLTTEHDKATRRESNIGNGLRVNEYTAKNSDYRSVDISAHDIDFASIKTTNRTLTVSGEKVKVKILSFKDSEGVNHEINLFSERY